MFASNQPAAGATGTRTDRDGPRYCTGARIVNVGPNFSHAMWRPGAWRRSTSATLQVTAARCGGYTTANARRERSTMRDESLVQIERNIARCRIILSIAAPLAVYLDPTEPTLLVHLTGGLFLIDPWALLVLLLHLAYSVGVYALVARTRVDVGRIATFSTWADVLFGAAVALVTEGTNSPFYIFFAFAVLAVGLRGTFRRTLTVTAISVALYLTLVLIFRPEGLGYYVTRGIYLAVTGYLVGVLGRQRQTLQSDLHGLARSLHDGYAQALAGVTLRVATARELLRRGRADEALVELTELQAGVTREYDELRAYVRSLLGLEARPAVLPRRDGTRFSVQVQFDGSLATVEHALQIMALGPPAARRRSATPGRP